MRYPSKYVLTTDLDDDEYETKCKMVPPIPIGEKSINDLGNPLTVHQPVIAATALPERIWQDCIANPLGMTAAALSALVSNSSNSSFGSSSGATATGSPATATAPAASPVIIKEEPGVVTSTVAEVSSTAGNPWEFVDPTLKATCSCTK